MSRSQIINTQRALLALIRQRRVLSNQQLAIICSQIIIARNAGHVPLAIAIRTARDVAIREIRIHIEVYVVVDRIADVAASKLCRTTANGRDGGGKSIGHGTRVYGWGVCERDIVKGDDAAAVYCAGFGCLNNAPSATVAARVKVGVLPVRNVVQAWATVFQLHVLRACGVGSAD